MKIEEKAYIAGIIDGEGSIMLTSFHKNQYPSPCVTITSTTLELLEWIQNKTGIGHIKSKKNYKPGTHSDSYTYITKYREAIYLLEHIEPYLIIRQKRLRAQMIIYEYNLVTPRNGRYFNELLKAKEDFYKKFMS